MHEEARDPASVPDAAEGLDDELRFLAEEAQPSLKAGTASPRWRILMVDDDEEVHQASTFALRGVEIDGRGLELLCASSASEARDILVREKDIAVIMLDVVMETPDAGLELVQIIREELGLATVRIILRTGQPGYAPELDAIRRFDINDYRTKSELTRPRLITALTAAIRAYAQLEAAALNNRGLSLIVEWSNELFRIRSSWIFAQTLIERLGQLLSCPPNGAVCVAGGAGADEPSQRMHVLHAKGDWADSVCRALEYPPTEHALHIVHRCWRNHANVMDGELFALWLGSSTRNALVCFNAGRQLSDVEWRLLNVFASSLSVGFENVDLFEQLDFFAFCDPLTRLPNRTGFVTEVDRHLESDRENGYCLAILDVVRFSDINDALGHRCGDMLLIAVGKRLGAVVGPGVIIARISGDSFGLYGSEDGVDANRIMGAFREPFLVQGHALSIQVRMGIARTIDGGKDAVELMSSANLAMSEVRMAGGAGSRIYTGAMSESVRKRVSLLHLLRAAIDFRRGLTVYYQPQVNGLTGQVVGVEALLRWRDDQGRMISPEQFVPLAERTGMIVELGQLVIDESLERLARWDLLGGYGDLRMSVNVSPVQLCAEGFVDRLLEAIALANVPAHRLTLEVTESSQLAESYDMLKDRLDRLHKLGVHFAIDDFGTGFSSLQQLTHLPIDVIKIDRSFVSNIANSARDRAVISSIVMLARSRQTEVLAEGVERAEQVQALNDLGCHHMQGFYFGPPMTGDEFEQWMQGRAAA